MFSKVLNSAISMSVALQYLLARECQVLLYTILIEACIGQCFLVAFGMFYVQCEQQSVGRNGCLLALSLQGPLKIVKCGGGANIYVGWGAG